MNVGVVAYSSEPSGRALASCAIALAPLPPSTFSTIIVAFMIRDRCGAMERRKTSLPPPGLECVTNVTTGVRFVLIHEPRPNAIKEIERTRIADWGTPAEDMTGAVRRVRYDTV